MELVEWGDDWELLLKPVMKSAGFKKKGRTWYLETPETVCVLNLQMSPWGGGDFYINLGVLVKAIENISWPKEYQCHFRERLCQLMPDLHRADALFHIRESYPIAREVRRTEILSAVDKIALPLLAQCRNVSKLRASLEAKPRLKYGATAALLQHLKIPDTHDW